MRLCSIVSLWIILTNNLSQEADASPDSTTTVIVNVNGKDNSECCRQGICNCSSLLNALENIRDGMTIIITSKSIVLNSIVQIRNRDRINITGLALESSVIQCKNKGGLSCNNCSNVTIENIVWDSCGEMGRSDLLGGVYFINPNNISVINCYFQNSSLRGFAVSYAVGNIAVQNSSFLNNHVLSNCNGGGMLVTGIPEGQQDFIELRISISDSLFSHNGYINDSRSARSCNIEGGGLSINISDDTSLTLSVSHSTFESNRAHRGGGMNLNANVSSVVLISTNFTNNFGVDGSGVYISYNAFLGTSSFHFVSSNFFNNFDLCSVFHCILGGAHVNFQIEKSIFSRNKVHHNLTSTVFFSITSMNSTVSMKNCNLTNNHHTAAIRMEILSQVYVNLNAVTFIGSKPKLYFQHAIYIDAAGYCTLDLKGLRITNYYSNAAHSILYIVGLNSNYGYYLNLVDSTFINNHCYGGIVYFNSNQRYHNHTDPLYLVRVSNCVFKDNNVGDTHAIVYIENESLENFWFIHIHSSSFINNIGSALYISNCGLKLEGNMLFQNNSAYSGAAIFCTKGTITNWNNGTIDFIDNFAKVRGGAIYVNIFYPCFEKKFFWDVKNVSVTFSGNFAQLAGNSMYFSLSEKCSYNTNISSNSSLLYYPSKFNYSRHFNEEVTTSPFRVKLSSPAICVNVNDTNTNDCLTCSIGDIMLGQEIVIPVQISDYFSTLTESLFFVTCMNCVHFQVGGTNPILLHDYLHGISIKGIEVLDKSNVTLYLSSIESCGDVALKEVCINLSVNLTTCFPGFIYDQDSRICVCYNKSALTCFGNNAKIKYGYWFGIWKDQTTVIFCPLGYCSYSNCDDNEYCTLSHVQDEQCRHHRAGPACGNCDFGYVLSFDSNHCVQQNSCFAGVTIVILISCFLYWVLLVVVIIALMNFNFEVGSGFAYGIIYFYSILDILLEGQVSNDGVSTFVAILTSFAKLLPQFLGTLCFIDDTEWSGIDQQFFHYVHPVGVSLIILLIVIAARYSTKLSMLISTSILRAICLLLLLSYTSVASTSVELLRPLKFHDISETFTYSSPSKLFFHGRHILYGIIAIICLIVIVIGFPLLLIVEPFISHKVDFSRIRPLLDHYQGCFKDKYRVFAGFYLLCRLAIITIIYAENTNYYNRLFLLNVVCIIVAMVHAIVMPYKNSNLNALDEIILLTIIFIINLNTGFSYTVFYAANTELIIAVVIFPLIAFAGYIVVSLKCNLFCKQKDNPDYISLVNSYAEDNDVSRPRHMLR